MTPRMDALFVYGTLMRVASAWRIGRAERERLARESDWLGPASLRARLYDLGDYPGVVLSETAGDVVHGEVVRLADPDHSFRWLDAYESIVPGDPDASEYVRAVVPVTLADGSVRDAWTYLYNRDLSALTPVFAGRWLQR